METIQAFDAWKTTKGKGQIIAILDTGVDPEHPDLKDKLLPGYDFINEDKDARDDHMHGTHVAGIAGVAPEAKILPVKVLQRLRPGYLQPNCARRAVCHGKRSHGHQHEPGRHRPLPYPQRCPEQGLQQSHAGSRCGE